MARAMVSRPVYQAILVVLAVATAASGLWLVLSPESTPGIEITFPPTATSPALEAASPSPETAPEPELVNIDTAPAEELARRLFGIGDILAGRIVEHREEHGPYRRVDQIMSVEGIGPATYERLRDRLTVGE